MQWSFGLAAAMLTVLCFAQVPDGADRRGARYTSRKQELADAAGKKDQPAYRDVLAKIHAELPENSRALRNLAAVEAGLGNGAEALELLRQYAAMGGTFDLKAEFWAPLREHAAKVPELARNEAPVSHGTRVFRLQDPDLLVEDVTYDESARRFLLSSVHEHKILSCDLTGACADFIQPSKDAIFALRMDLKRHVVWATTADMAAGKSALLRFDQRSGKLLQRWEAPADGSKHTLGDLTVAANGDVFASDGLSGDVFTLSKSGKLEKLVPAGAFLSPQTPALSPDGNLLYVPDYILGIAVIRLGDRHIEWLKSEIAAALEGIDGLYNVGGRLIAVQNGTLPPRIVELRLNSRGALDKVTVLEANWQGFGEPTHGVAVGRDFYFIVNSGWDRTDDGREMKPGNPAELWKLPLDR